MRKQFRRGAFLVICVALLVGCLSLVAFAAENVEQEITGGATAQQLAVSGTCGEKVKWKIADDVMTIYGTGDMDNYTSWEEWPWLGHSDDFSTVVIKDGVTSIGSYSFEGCHRIEKVTIPDSVTTIGQTAFAGCVNLKDVNIPYGVTFIGSNAFCDCSSLTEITIPNSVTWIDPYAFGGCSGLTSVNIPASVECVEQDAFMNCNNLKAIYVDEDNKNYCDVGGVLYNKDKTGLTFYPPAKTSKTYKMPDTVRSVCTEALNNCTNLTSIELSGSLTEAYGIMNGCTNLTTVKIPVSLRVIGDNTFAGCSSLKKVIYTGTRSEWKQVEIRQGNEYLEKAKVVFLVSIVKSSVPYELQCGERVKVYWDEVPGADAYYIFCVDSSGNVINCRARATGTYFYDSYAGPGFAYQYRIRAVNESNGTPACETPTLTAYNDADSGKIELSWDKVEGAEQYYIYRSTSENGPFNYYDNTTKTSYTNGNTTLGVCYYYKVKAIGVSGEYTNSELSSTVYATRACERPVVTASADAVTGKVKLSWDPIQGAGLYYIYRYDIKTNSETYYTSTKNTYYIDKSTQSGVRYYYKVKAIHEKNQNANSAISRYVCADSKCARPNVTSDIVASTGKIKLSWDKVKGAGQYYIYRSTSKDGTFKYYDKTTGTSYTDGSTTPGTCYYYKVKAVSGSDDYANSELSSYVYATRDCARPVVEATTDTSSGKVKLSWGKVSGADEYYIYRYDSESDTYEYYASTKETCFVNKSTVPGECYYYKVKAICEKSQYGNSAQSSYVYATCDCAQPEVKATTDGATGKVKLSWSKVSGADEYYVYRYDSAAGTYKYIKSVTGTSCMDGYIDPGVVGTYRVKAVCGDNSYGNSALSERVSVTRDCAKPVIGITRSSGKPKISWSAVDGASQYYIYRWDNETESYKYLASTTETSYTHKKAVAGKTYYYRVKAVCGESQYGNSVMSASKYITAK